MYFICVAVNPLKAGVLGSGLVLLTLCVSHVLFQMPLGRQCVDHYRMLHRYNVFSHDEMVCNMASKADTLDVVLASAVHKDMVAMIRDEGKMREKVKRMVGWLKHSVSHSTWTCF